MNQHDLQKQSALANLAMQKQKLVNERLDERLKIDQFPIENTSQQWKELMAKATEKTQPMACNFPLSEFVEVQMFGEPGYGTITLNTFRGLNNCLEVVSRTELGISRQQYKEFVTECLEHIKTYAGIVKNLTDEINIEVEKEHMVKNAKGKPIMAAVVGEA